MKVVDARSGRVLEVGQMADYGRGEYVQLLEVEPGLFDARARVRRRYRDMSKALPCPGSMRYSPIVDGVANVLYPSFGWTVDPESAPLVEDEIVVPLVVRWLHPKYLLQHVGFIPS